MLSKDRSRSQQKNFGSFIQILQWSVDFKIIYIGGQAAVDHLLGTGTINGERYFSDKTVYALFTEMKSILRNRFVFTAGGGVGIRAHFTVIVYRVNIIGPVRWQKELSSYL